MNLINFDFIPLISFFIIGGLIGAISSLIVLSKKNIEADVASHATLPGILFISLLLKTENPFFLLIGALLSSAIALIIVSFLQQNFSFSQDSILAFILFLFLGLGIALEEIINFFQFDINIMKIRLEGDITLLHKWQNTLFFFLLLCGLVFLFFLLEKKLQLFLFDSLFFQLHYQSKNYINLFLNLLVIIAANIGIYILGTILVSILLLIPGLLAKKISNNFRYNFFFALFFNAFVCSISFILNETIFDFLPLRVLIVFCLLIFALSFFLLNKYIFKNNFKKGIFKL